MNVALAIVYRKHDNRFLFLKRKHSSGELDWVFPGGKVEPSDICTNHSSSQKGFETDGFKICSGNLLKAAARELFEETGLECKSKHGLLIDSRTHPATDVKAFYVLFSHHTCAPSIKEPEKFEAISWLSSDEIESAIGMENFSYSVRYYIQNIDKIDPEICQLKEKKVKALKYEQHELVFDQPST